MHQVLKESGGRGKDTVFLFNESQIKEDLFLQDIDALLNSGEVPNIFPIDEKQEILELVRLAAQGGNRNMDVSPLQVGGGGGREYYVVIYIIYITVQ